LIELIKPLLGESNPALVQLIKDIPQNYIDLLTTQEIKLLNKLISDYDVTGILAHTETFIREYPEFRHSLEAAKLYTHDELPAQIQLYFHKRSRQKASAELMEIANSVLDEGVTLDTIERLSYIQPEVGLDYEEHKLSLYDQYKRRKNLPLGIETGIPEIDSVIGGIPKGHVATILAWTGSYKSTWAVNMLHHNSYKLGYNQLLISLEIPKEDIYWNLLSLHSSLPKFSKYPHIPHDKIRKGELTQDEENYLFETIEPDLTENSKGRIFIYDESDFKSQSLGELRSLIDMADDQCGNQLDTVFYDHIGLFKYAETQQRNLGTGELINKYVSFIRQLSIRFRRNADNPQEWRKLASVILVQANRDGWQRAAKNGGRYSLRAIAEANEVERASSLVFSIYTSEDMKLAKEALVSLIKSRYSQTIYEPVLVFADPVCYKIGEESQATLDGQDIDAVFDSLLGIDPVKQGFGKEQLTFDEFD